MTGSCQHTGARRRPGGVYIGEIIAMDSHQLNVAEHKQTQATPAQSTASVHRAIRLALLRMAERPRCHSQGKRSARPGR